MTSLRPLLHGMRVGIARMLSSFSGRPVPLEPRKLLAAYQKVILLGVWLLLSCAAVAGMGIWGVTAIRRDHVELTRREVPALALLLRIDTDLYQAQLGLERAAGTSDPLQRKAALDFYAENVTESEKRFAIYKTLAVGVEEEAVAIIAYTTDREKWLTATGELTRALAGARNSAPRDGVTGGVSAAVELPAAGTTFEITRGPFETMRGRLNRIVTDVYQPAIEASGVQADQNSRLTCWKLISGVFVALLAGVTLTRGMARTLQIQQRATESMDAEREKQNCRQRFEARLSRGLDMTQDEPATLKLVEEVIAVVAPGVTAEVLLADSSRAHLHQAATTDREHQGRGCAVAKPSDCPAVRRGHRLNFESGGAFDACPHLKNRPGGNCSAVCIPLSIMGQTVGVLHATAADGHLPPEDHILALEQLASKSGERLGLLRAFRRTEAQASSDPLTGLMNRRSLEEKVHELNRQNVPFAVAYGDLDHFKNLNDTYGHETGDKALRTFAQVLKASIRPGDLAARWGGEEFILVLPHASSDEAVAVLDRVRQALASVLQKADTPAFTVSFGIAQTAEGTLFVDVLARADESLLRAKREGRNRTINSPEIVPVRLPTIAAGDELTVGQDDALPTSAAA